MSICNVENTPKKSFLKYKLRVYNLMTMYDTWN